MNISTPQRDHLIRNYSLVTLVLLAVLFALAQIPRTPPIEEPVPVEQSELDLNDSDSVLEVYKSVGEEVVVGSLPDEFDIVARDEFAQQLEEDCPYYEPDGLTYKYCLADKLEEQETIIKDAVVELAQDLQTLKEYYDRDETTRLAFSGPSDAFAQNMKDLVPAWLAYRDVLCEAEVNEFYYGTAQSGALMTCKLYEGQVMTHKIVRFRLQYIGVAADEINEKEKDLSSYSDTFRSLIEREVSFMSS